MASIALVDFSPVSSLEINQVARMWRLISKLPSEVLIGSMSETVFPLFTPEALAAMALLGCPIYIYNFETERVAWANAEALRFWNAETASELISRELTPYSDSTQLRLAEYRDSFRKGKVVTESWTFYPKGAATPTISRCRGVSLEGCPEAMMVEIQILSRAELPSAELRSIEVLRHTSLMASMFSETGEVLMRNPAAQACFAEMESSRSPQDDMFSAMFADPLDCQQLLGNAAATGNTTARSATMAIEGLPVHALQLSLLTDPADGQVALLVTQQDMTQLSQISRQLVASEAALDSVLSLSVGPALVIATQDNRVLKANFAAQALLGPVVKSDAKADGYFVSPTAYDAFRSAVLESGAGTLQMQMNSADGTSFWAAVSGARITYEKQDALVVLATDINELYQLKADLEAALDNERQTTGMQRRFLAIAAHDLRTPLAVIDNTAQMLERSVAPGTSDQSRAWASRIRATVRRMLRLLENTIESTRKSLGTLGYAPVEGQISTVITLVARSLQEANPELELSLDLPPLPPISFDRHLIEQALSNLLTNAIKYADGKPCVHIKVVARSEDIQIIIRDYGIGIPVLERESVFDEYVRAANVGERPGTGMGLSIVRQIASLHGGSIDIVDVGGKGVAIRLSLPRELATQTQDRAKTA